MRGTCEVCGEAFVTHSKTIQYTCSNQCRVEKNKNKFMEDMKKFYPRIEYVGGYIDKNTKAQFKCNVCGGIFERTPTKMSDKNSVGQCPLCKLTEPRVCPKCGRKHINKHRRWLCEECANEVSKTYELSCSNCGKDFVSKNKDKLTCSYECMLEFGKALRKNEYKPKTKECKNCGANFVTEYGKTNEDFCSDKCRRRMKNRKRRLYEKNIRMARAINNGRVDKDITLDRLSARDNGLCHICNKKVDEEDYIINDEGYLICGDMYPSIDHVIPIAKGGTHTWDNVKLAHRLCNSYKGDKTG